MPKSPRYYNTQLREKPHLPFEIMMFTIKGSSRIITFVLVPKNLVKAWEEAFL
jgi:hypothetical protein